VIKCKEKTLETSTNEEKLKFSVQWMKGYYTLFKDSCSITEEKIFNFIGLANEFPNRIHQFTTRDWLPLADEPRDYLKELFIEFYASYQVR